VKVLHIDTATEFRGGQRQLALLLAGRAGDAWAGVPEGPLAGEVGPPDVALRPGNDPRNVFALRGLPYDLVVAHTAHAHGVALASGRPVVVHRRVDFAPRDRWKYRLVSGFVAVSTAVSDVLVNAGVPVRRVHVVHDGVDPLPVGVPVKGPRPLYGAMGALVDHKGHRHLVEAMRHVPGHLWIAGEGPLRRDLESRILAAGLGDRVRLLGHIQDVGGFLAGIDVFVHPSVEEGLGQSVIEAMAAGCRVVATRAGGVPEVLGDTGILVDPADVPALAAALREGLKLPRENGVERAAAFSVARMVEATGTAYSRIFEGVE